MLTEEDFDVALHDLGNYERDYDGARKARALLCADREELLLELAAALERAEKAEADNAALMGFAHAIEAWVNGLPQMTQELYDWWMALQRRRNELLAAPNPGAEWLERLRSNCSGAQANNAALRRVLDYVRMALEAQHARCEDGACSFCGTVYGVAAEAHDKGCPRYVIGEA